MLTSLFSGGRIIIPIDGNRRTIQELKALLNILRQSPDYAIKLSTKNFGFEEGTSLCCILYLKCRDAEVCIRCQTS